MSEALQSLQQRLRVDNHDRDSAGLVYVYPVISRRAGGVSVGINLNPNNACNWRCLYCQVPDLQRGAAPEINLVQLEDELRWMLFQILHGDFMCARVPAEVRRLNDVAFSGNGEPTTSKQFAECVDLVGRVLADFGLLGQIKLVLITNGSQLDRPDVQAGIARMAACHGEVWYKFDRAPDGEFNEVNQVRLSVSQVARRLDSAAQRCPTWLQTCMFVLDGKLPSESAIQSWLDFVAARLADGVPLRGVLLYGLARPSMQPEAGRLGAAPEWWMRQLQARIEALGLSVKLSL